MVTRLLQLHCIYVRTENMAFVQIYRKKIVDLKKLAQRALVA